MRSPLDRLRHALMFEILALALVVPAGAILFGFQVLDFGVVGVTSATLAMLWNIVYNYLFDRALKHATGTTQKAGPIRILHAIVFEIGMLAVLIPFIAWYLDLSLWHAFVTDVALAGFYVVFAIAFNWAYDKAFPLPEWRKPLSSD